MERVECLQLVFHAADEKVFVYHLPGSWAIDDFVHLLEHISVLGIEFFGFVLLGLVGGLGIDGSRCFVNP